MSLFLLSSAFSKNLILELKQRSVSFSATVRDMDTFMQYVEFLQKGGKKRFMNQIRNQKEVLAEERKQKMQAVQLRFHIHSKSHSLDYRWIANGSRGRRIEAFLWEKHELVPQ